jgi:hypothetical protein
VFLRTFIAIAGLLAYIGWAHAQTSSTSVSASPSVSEAQRLLYNGHFDEAAALALLLRAQDDENLGLYELRTSALLLRLKRELGDAKDKGKALKQCAGCAVWMEAFARDIARGQTLARVRVRTAANDHTALFFLGKLNLNHVWLHLGVLGRKTGWDQYWEARRSLDALLKQNPQHVRGRVARAWIDYIVDTRMPMGTRWILGGGSRKRALKTMSEAASTEAEFFVETEAAFALWDLHAREKRWAEAVVIARKLAEQFPENQEIAKFLQMRDPGL